jgi:hypothetical protein
MRNLHRLLACLLPLSTLPAPAPADEAEIARPNALSFYMGRISSEETWHDVLLKPYSSNYTDAYLATVAYSRAWRETHEGALRSESEVNATFNFGDQSYWELNVVPLTLRWQRFPWNEHLYTTLAFGAGFSYAFKFPRSSTSSRTTRSSSWCSGCWKSPPARVKVHGRPSFACTTARRPGARWALPMAA